MSNKEQIRHQTAGAKNKCIDQVYVKMIDRRIQDRMNKMTMNRPLEWARLHARVTLPLWIILLILMNCILKFCIIVYHNQSNGTAMVVLAWCEAWLNVKSYSQESGVKWLEECPLLQLLVEKIPQVEKLYLFESHNSTCLD